MLVKGLAPSAGSGHAYSVGGALRYGGGIGGRGGRWRIPLDRGNIQANEALRAGYQRVGGSIMQPRHKVFVSYHHVNDQAYRTAFEQMFANTYDILVSRSVQIGDLDPNLKVETIRQKIREEYLRDSTVTVALVGSQTWQRKHVDWEIGASIRQTQYHPRSGLLGILLPSYPFPSPNRFDPYTIPPRLHDNIECGFAKIYLWDSNPVNVSSWIQEAFQRRNSIIPDNSYPSFVNNRSGARWSR